jgi:Holliday junction resolvase
MVAIRRALLASFKVSSTKNVKIRAKPKGVEMFRNFVMHFRAAVALIAAENLKALRVLIKNIGESFTKSFHADRTQH